MPWGQFITQWLHVFFATVWLGGTVFVFTVIGPALRSADPAAALEVGHRLGQRTHMLLAPAGALTIIFGLLRATVYGPARSWDFFQGSAYGMTLGAALILAIIIAVLGAVNGRIARSLSTVPDAERPKLLRRISLLSGLSILGLCLGLTCMVLMRYGL